MNAVAIMVLGCTSGAGKSWLATALCRWYADRGLRVAPFKAQNMSNHARVVSSTDGCGEGSGEVGSAQYFQALAARTTPQVRMNPVLLKPESDTRSQVVVMGRVEHALATVPWRERSELLWRHASDALASLREDFDLLVIEGAGSPAEINLATSDYVNTRTALAADAACLLVVDIDRGGAFAHLYGTHALMDVAVRAHLRGFVLNRFRGDPGLLAPAPQVLRRYTGVPTVAVLPMLRDHGLPEEDAVPANDAVDRGSPGAGTRVVVLAGPHASNLDEFEPLRAAGLSLEFSRDAAAIEGADWLVLPGSKHTRADLAWMRANGLDATVRAHVAQGKPLLAICGGLQIAGVRIDDPLRVEGGAGIHDRGSESSRDDGGRGLALLPIVTRLAPIKTLARTRARFARLDGAWAALSGLEVEGYEIHHGETGSLDRALCAALADEREASVLGWQLGPILAVYLHGLFENRAVVRALFNRDARSLDTVFDALAAHVDAHFDPGFLLSLAESR